MALKLAEEQAKKEEEEQKEEEANNPMKLLGMHLSKSYRLYYYFFLCNRKHEG